ncbi:uncharacterized protein F5Z01DRAFT_45929 [Emericellopsis atlantica]|uniref:Uncharacterized protein n=1 Tax=Emericellopsis atlantica TaxID=2614577 RepID=A0A9P7ZPD4_9HYPO|nr:uncharacterized protein F5Z01DRAFT_45929 [Emericellopsis atlantica]KAG9255275.1 hypothetical protein F5Z01DRAFT_45929 [Emericellopsis atlantica]
MLRSIVRGQAVHPRKTIDTRTLHGRSQPTHHVSESFTCPYSTWHTVPVEISQDSCLSWCFSLAKARPGHRRQMAGLFCAKATMVCISDAVEIDDYLVCLVAIQQRSAYVQGRDVVAYSRRWQSKDLRMDSLFVISAACLPFRICRTPRLRSFAGTYCSINYSIIPNFQLIKIRHSPPISTSLCPRQLPNEDMDTLRGTKRSVMSDPKRGHDLLEGAQCQHAMGSRWIETAQVLGPQTCWNLATSDDIDRSPFG